MFVVSTVVVMALITLTSPTPPRSENDQIRLHTSWYGPGFQGKTMANGKRFNASDPTIAAHKDLPFGTKLELKNPDNDHCLVVEVKDRGPFVAGRELDISKAAAKKLGVIEEGVSTLFARVILPE
ncbi:MAG: Rare lipoprotein A [Parcubacteria group bacterium GW2011_GWC1_43_11b]|uniref:RlpA-like protein double-psi beta-barrel domain-containing protein n=2 Tax=Candidatus Vogeliibacteriota TaxID=1817922 RepID=A0A1G2QDE3_9BACT|nr:MAG: Rare lipoprotein A [Parcubacteria group bacterium GW2011_GWB1_42_9]KKS88586.1 MAG: Rare lipoprotein A [Parcubacteria group bacterium GW2011_GWC1_43_11b]KKT09434.1 MAG: Rare lipoprotein A [Parcubacteria group bacterium GW2011_GWA1_43_21]OHA57981.1 MAG: hypothetical protein A2370_01140 [Candidatus Vogelbacteria bacterium RIFOXYB1_FULL_42_16]OHA59738.1 MAG: hypothetical protein A2607_02200 [Candidatus Vogelbacteria bacterium RIFOXYD1_FULL_42_15]